MAEINLKDILNDLDELERREKRLTREYERSMSTLETSRVKLQKIKSAFIEGENVDIVNVGTKMVVEGNPLMFFDSPALFDAYVDEMIHLLKNNMFNQENVQITDNAYGGNASPYIQTCTKNMTVRYHPSLFSMYAREMLSTDEQEALLLALVAFKESDGVKTVSVNPRDFRRKETLTRENGFSISNHYPPSAVYSVTMCKEMFTLLKSMNFAQAIEDYIIFIAQSQMHGSFALTYREYSNFFYEPHVRVDNENNAFIIEKKRKSND